MWTIAVKVYGIRTESEIQLYKLFYTKAAALNYIDEHDLLPFCRRVFGDEPLIFQATAKYIQLEDI